MSMSYEVKPHYSFNVEQSGDTYTFTYKRAKYSLALYAPLAVIMGIVIMLFTFILSKTTSGLTNGLALALGLPVFIYLFVNYTRKDGRFQVSPTHITIGGSSYNRSHIHRVYVQLPDKYTQDVYIPSGFPVLGNKISDQIAAKNYIVGFIYAERHIKLAGGMNETTAHVLYDKIRDILKFYN